MRKVIAAINMTLDGVCDHTVGIPDEDLHTHYSDLLSSAGVILYGRVTYELMQYWQGVLEKPSGQPATDAFARAIDSIPKIVFSHTLEETGWNSASLPQTDPASEVAALKQHPGKDILVGSRSLIIQLINLGLVDEFQICIYPMVEGQGLPLFDKIDHRKIFKLLNTKILSSGAVILFYGMNRS